MQIANADNSDERVYLQHRMHPHLTEIVRLSYPKAMARPRSSAPKSVAQLVREQRDGLYAAGHQNLNMALAAPVIAQIDAWKRRHRLRSRDAVVALVIRQCMTLTEPEAFILRAAPRTDDTRRISPIVPADLADYVKRIQRHFHGIAYGPVFEMIVAEVGPDLNDNWPTEHEPLTVRESTMRASVVLSRTVPGVAVP